MNMKKYTLRIEAPRASLSVEIGTVYSRRDADEIYLQLKGELNNYGIYTRLGRDYNTVTGQIIFTFSTSNRANIDKLLANIVFCKYVAVTKEWVDYIGAAKSKYANNQQEVKQPEAVKEVIKEEKKADKFIDTILGFKTLKVR